MNGLKAEHACWAIAAPLLGERREQPGAGQDMAKATGEDNLLSEEQLRRLPEEAIELEDLKTGVSITDLGLNDFRMDLLNYVKERTEQSAQRHARRELHNEL